MKARDFIPALRFGAKIYPEDIAGITPMTQTNQYWFVDGDKSADGGGKSWEDAYNDIQSAVTAASEGDVIFIAPKSITALATDPVSYAETIIIPNNKPNLSLIGVSRGRTQGGLPQIKIGAGSTALLTIRAPGCLIANLGFNGVDSTGGGILLDDDTGTSKVAFGTTIANCHIKNCVGATATDGKTGPGILMKGAPWQVLITGNRFWRNVGDVAAEATYVDAQDVVIEDNIFGGPASVTDINIYMYGTGASATGLVIRNNVFYAMPALSGGANKRFLILTGYTGILANNQFATITDPVLSETTFAAAGTGAFIPATVFMAGNTGEVQATGNTANYAAIGRYL